MGNADRKAAADRILYEFGLLERLEEIGKAHIIGSYRMDMMAWNDLDIDIENSGMSMEKLYALTVFIIERFRPDWYEAKQVIDDKGRAFWFQGFEPTVTGDKWNVERWFFSEDAIAEAEAYCDDISARATSQQREYIVAIKQELIASGLYSFEQFKSMDVYKAVLEDGAKDIESFLALFESEKASV